MDPSPHRTVQELSAIDPADRTDRTVRLDDVDLHLRHAPEPGVWLRVEATDPHEPGVVVNTVFDRGADRPPSYPPELPYLSGSRVSVLAVPDHAGAVATWFKLDDVEGAFAEIRAQSEAAGWTESTGSEDPLPPGLRMIALTRPGWRRSIIVGSLPGHGTITLADSEQAA